mmetsp:Transcript_2920/g.9016  ORF Transcript_2920/g.9016 Transcript_2920/m.9016 type:complete len:266 (-) Transcript_2920:197-994(-)
MRQHVVIRRRGALGTRPGTVGHARRGRGLARVRADRSRRPRTALPRDFRRSRRLAKHRGDGKARRRGREVDARRVRGLGRPRLGAGLGPRRRVPLSPWFFRGERTASAARPFLGTGIDRARAGLAERRPLDEGERETRGRATDRRLRRRRRRLRRGRIATGARPRGAVDVLGGPVLRLLEGRRLRAHGIRFCLYRFAPAGPGIRRLRVCRVWRVGDSHGVWPRRERRVPGHVPQARRPLAGRRREGRRRRVCGSGGDVRLRQLVL